MLDEKTAQAIRRDFKAGLLKVRSVDPQTGGVRLSAVSDVMRHNTEHKDMVSVAVSGGKAVQCTVDHSLISPSGEGVKSVQGGKLKPGDFLASVVGGQLRSVEVVSAKTEEPHEHTYDLCVPGDENFVLSNGIVAHNSYSIGGISLDIQRSSNYESLKSNAESRWESATEMKQRTTKILRGLQQPKYGIGIRSSFGPALGRGVLSPRSFLS